MTKRIKIQLGLIVCLAINVGIWPDEADANESQSFNCRIEPHTRVDVSSATEGVVESVLVKKNDTVEAGSILARLESSLESATLDLRRFQSKMDSDINAQILAVRFSKRNLDRVKNLFDKKAASASELDKAKTEHELAEQNLRQAKDKKQKADYEYKRVEADLARRTIVSPLSGLVVERYKEPGEHIYFEPIIQVVQLDPLKVETFVPALFFGQIKEGMTAVVRPEISLGERTIQAEVLRVDRVVDGASGTFGVEVSIPNPLLQIPSGVKCKVEFPDIPSTLAQR